MHGDRADRVVDLELALDEDDGADHDEAGDDADDEGADRVDEGARRGDGDEAGQHAVGGHRRVGLAVLLPHQEHRREAAGRARR